MRALRYAVVAALAAAPMLVTTGMAQASAPAAGATPGPLIHHEVKYHAHWLRKDGTLGVCITYNGTGDIKYNTQVQEPSGAIEWTRQRLSPQPKFTARVRTYRHRQCGTTAKLYKITMSQHWTGLSCSFNPSISFSAPWGVGISFWPSCANRNQVTYTSDFGRSSYYAQYTNGVPPVHFGDYGGLPGQRPCYAVYASAQNYINNHKSNLYRSKSHGVCLVS